MARKVGSKNKVKKVEVVKHKKIAVTYEIIGNGTVAEICFGEGFDENYSDMKLYSKSNAGIRRLTNKLVRERLG